MSQGLEAMERHRDIARVRVLLLPLESLPAHACAAGRFPQSSPQLRAH